jgi:hypothetical protein
MLDEVVAPLVQNFHLEQMSAGHWWLGFEAAGRRWCLNFHARGKIAARIEDDGPGESPPIAQTIVARKMP